MMRKLKFIIFNRFYWFAGKLKILYFLQCNVPHFNLILANELKTKQNEGDLAPRSSPVNPTGQDAKPFSFSPPPPPSPHLPPTLSSHPMSPCLRKCHIRLVSLLSLTHPSLQRSSSRLLSPHSVSLLVYTSVSLKFLR